MYACPVGAIRLVEDSCGAEFAMLDESLCVKCGRCATVCHICTLCEKKTPEAVCAVWACDADKEVSSGGIGSLLYNKFIDSGAVVVGVDWDGEMNAVHRVTENAEDIARFRGSKYVKSDLSGAIPEIGAALKNDRRVLFIGLPCQVSAIKRLYDCEGLYTADLVCHGVPPAGYFKEYIASLGQEDVRSARFRGSEDFVLRLFDGDGECAYRCGQHDDPYFKAFLVGLTYRENCYECRYACSERVGDITLGDFWGLKKSTQEAPREGRASLVLVNTEKGKRLFELISNHCIFEEHTLEEAVRENGQLKAPSARHPERARFIKNYSKYGFVKALKKTKIAKEIKNRNKFFAKVKRKIALIFGR